MNAVTLHNDPTEICFVYLFMTKQLILVLNKHIKPNVMSYMKLLLFHKVTSFKLTSRVKHLKN